MIAGDERDRAAALADRSRRRVFETIRVATEPIGIAELAAVCGVHPNTVRLHVERLVAAGLVRRAPDGARRPGRPPHRYVATGTDPTREAAAYRRLAALLATAVRNRESARIAGRRAATQRDAPSARDPVRAMAAQMEAEGFRPSVDAAGPNPEIVLQVCPFADLAAQEPATICQLHLGIAEGASEAIGGVRVERLVPGNPFEGGCRLVLRRMPT